MLGLNIAFPADSSSCRVVQKLERFEVGGVELVKVTARKSVWNPWNLRNDAAARTAGGGQDVFLAVSERLRSVSRPLDTALGTLHIGSLCPTEWRRLPSSTNSWRSDKRTQSTHGSRRDDPRKVLALCTGPAYPDNSVAKQKEPTPRDSDQLHKQQKS